MIEIKAIDCSYCGAPLRLVSGSLWYCDGCGRNAIVHTYNSPSLSNHVQKAISFNVEIRREDEVYDIVSNGAFELLFKYKRRATRADPFPASIYLNDQNGSHLLIDDAPLFEEDLIQLIYDGSVFRLSTFQKGMMKKSTTVKNGCSVSVNGFIISPKLIG